MFKRTTKNFAVTLAKLSIGARMKVLAPDWFAIKPSLLPSSTVYKGPPPYICYKK